MCSKYYDETHDIQINPKGPGKVGWKVTARKLTGWSYVVSRQKGWMKAKADDGRDTWGRPGQFRAGFHGFCFFFTRKEAEDHMKSEHTGGSVRKVRVRGLIKKAAADRGQDCYLAEQIRFYKRDGKTFE